MILGRFIGKFINKFSGCWLLVVGCLLLERSKTKSLKHPVSFTDTPLIVILEGNLTSKHPVSFTDTPLIVILEGNLTTKLPCSRNHRFLLDDGRS
ncbi:hypothetical protein SAMN04488588_2000 [Geotoga petraea]|uniref:Uncharacterized protein n=1 Tax=Geotoga petraea TaxID=28234 RepID=A0A1G6Q7K6_9BACT|nr:hypothetical protein SAMN04488588_2000 [Geotoga petraea]